MNEFKMSLFLAPISPVKDGGTGQIIKPATLKPYKTMTLQEVYRTITANTRLQLLTDRVRRAFDSGDLSAYRALKQELLPYVTPCGVFTRRRSDCLTESCGTFARRRSDSLLEASGLVVVDIDHLDSADEAARLRRQLFEDPFLRPELVFISPCGQGVKAFVPYTPDPALPDVRQNAAESIRWAMDYVQCVYADGNRNSAKGVDTSGKDLVRACFLSYDPGALIATRNNLSPENNPLQNQ